MLPDQSPCYRYPGTKPFEAAEHELFKGRDNDINHLSELVSLQNLVVLFGRSGLGKSSLLNAGLVNCLRKDPGVMVLFVRFGAYYDQNTLSPLARLQAQISGESGTNSSNFIYNKLIPEEAITLHHLWYAFKNFQLARPEQQTVVLIFDQFEELFTYPEKEIDVFKKDLSELLYISVPQQLRNLLKDRLLLDPAYLAKEEKELLFRPLNVKVLFSIRSDKLSLLNTLTDFFPSVLNVCYELKPLNREQARQAIEEPAKLEDRKYISSPFVFTEEAIALLLNTLTEVKHSKEERSTDQKPEIETFQLQIVCKHAENLVMEKALRQISVSDLGNIKEIFENHYRNLIAKVHPDKQLSARRLIEEKLIIDGNRVSMPIPFILRDEDMTTELLDELINTHVLRREQNNTVEISHDTLVEPILKYYEERKKQETVANELREKEEQIKRIKELQEAESQQQKARRNKLLVSIIGIALILTLGLAAYALNESRVANQQRNYAEVQRLRADSIAKIATFERDNARMEKEKASRSAQEAILAQHRAEIQRKRADSNALVAMAALRDAEIQKKRADSNALRAEEEANKARDAYEDQTRGVLTTIRIMEAFRLTVLAYEWIDKDPTIALRIEEAAMQKFSDPMIEKVAQQIFEKHGFYKKIGDQEKLPELPKSLSPDGKAFVSDSGLWGIDGTKRWSFKETAGEIIDVAFAPDRQTVVTGSGDGIVRLWNSKGEPLKKFSGNRAPIHAVAISPEADKIFAIHRYEDAFVWGPDSTVLWKGKSEQTRHFRFGTFSPDGENIFMGPYFDTAYLWNIRKDTLVKKFVGMQNTKLAVFSPDGKWILTNEGLLGLEMSGWDFEYSNAGSVHCFAFSPDGERIATASSDDRIRLWRAKDGKLLQSFDGPEQVSSVAFTSNGRSILTSSPDSTVRLWHLNGSAITEFTIPKENKALTLMSFSVVDQNTLTCSNDSLIELWNADGKLVKEFPTQKDTVTAIALSPDGTKVFAAFSGGRCRIWNKGGTILAEWNMKKERSTVTAAGFSWDGTKLLTAFKDGNVSLRSESGTFLKDLGQTEAWLGTITSVSLSPDEKNVLVATTPKAYRNTNERVFLWSIDDAKKKDLGYGSSAAFSPDGKKIITGKRRGLYGASEYTLDGTLLHNFNTDHAVLAVGFSPDGTKVFTGSTYGLVRVWESAMTMQEFLQSDQLNQLTEKQKKEFGIR